MASQHCLAYALEDYSKFQNFDITLRVILPHCSKVMAPLSKMQKLGLHENNILSKAAEYQLGCLKYKNVEIFLNKVKK